MSGSAQDDEAGAVSGEVCRHRRSLAPSRPARLGQPRQANRCPKIRRALVRPTATLTEPVLPSAATSSVRRRQLPSPLASHLR
jgi:hypothetical protein